MDFRSRPSFLKMKTKKQYQIYVLYMKWYNCCLRVINQVMHSRPAILTDGHTVTPGFFGIGDVFDHLTHHESFPEDDEILIERVAESPPKPKLCALRVTFRDLECNFFV